MRASGVRTPIIRVGDSLEQILTSSLKRFEEESVLVITSKVVSLCEQAVMPTTTPLPELVKQDAEWYTESTESKYNLMLTIKHQHLSINAGIDYSNADGQAVLLPRDPQASATRIWTFLRSELQLKSLGVVIIDSVPFPLKWGQTARSLAHCGFIGLDDLTGQPDVFGRTLEMTKMSLVEGVAAAAHLEMGEAAEQTPVAVVTNVSRLQFQDRPPSLAELSQLSISTEDDAFAPLLSTSKWKQGGGGINL